jgi:cbb3-type cytochrome oxidase maturation protein
MDIIFVLIPLSLVLLGVAVWAFFWAVRSRQFDNLDAEAWRILLDGDRKAPPESPAPEPRQRRGTADPGE